MGQLVMPRNRLPAFAVHGLTALAPFIPPARAIFEELKMKPLSRFKHGLFAKGTTHSKLVRGGMLPQGLVRSAPGAPTVPSDDVLGLRLALVGFGCDPAAHRVTRDILEGMRTGVLAGNQRMHPACPVGRKRPHVGGDGNTDADVEL